MAKERFGLIGTVHLLLERDGKRLFLRRSNTGYMDGCFSLVAGHVEDGESVREAAAREAREEVGVVLEPEALELLHVMHRNENQSRIDFFFRAACDGGVENCEPHKHDKLEWAEEGKLPGETVPYIKEALERIKRGSFFSQLYW